MNIKEFEEKYGKKLTHGNPYYGLDFYTVRSEESRDSEVILRRRITETDYFECYTYGDPTIREDFLKVTDELEKIRKYKGKTIEQVLNEFNEKHFPKMSGMIVDEGYPSPIYKVFLNTDCKKFIAGLKEGVIAFDLSITEFDPEIIKPAVDLLHDIHQIMEIENVIG